MRKILFILAVLTGICVAFSDELRNKTALTVKTSEPFSNSIICGDIDSITFSNIALDGSVHDSVVIQKIYTPDSVLTYVLDSIQTITLEDVSEYVEIRENFSNLSDYMTETKSYGDSYDQVVEKINLWLGKQSNVTEWTFLDDKLGFEVKYNNGYTGMIYFLYNTSNDEKQSLTKKDIARGRSVNEVMYYNVASCSDESILYNSRIMCFQGCNDMLMSYFIGGATGWKNEISSYQEVLDISPINALIYSNKNIGELNFLSQELAKSDLAIITHTHGEGKEGRFLINSCDYNLKYLKYLNPCMLFAFNDNALITWDKISRTAWVGPKILDDYKSNDGVGVLNYCWSNKFREHVDANNNDQKSFIGYKLKANIDANIERVRSYLLCLANGYTHSDAINEINQHAFEFSDGLPFEYDRECHARFFSIEDLGGYSVPLRDYCSAKYKIRGWKNLKKEIDKVKIWYKGERFEHPDESCITVEYDLKEQYMYHYGLHDWLYDMGPCIVGDKLSFNSEGPDFYVNVMLNGIDADTLYYALGFEYNNGDVRNVYHSDVTAVGGIMPGVTPGQCIDMGLPSGTKWAAWNVGASKPEEYGGSYGWGEPTGTYTEQPYSTPVAGGYSNYAEVVPHYGGENPASNISGSKYDIAHAKWGNGWHLPSVEQWNELMNDEYTTWQHYTLNGVRGLRIISKINGNKLFFPVEFGNLNGGIGSSSFWTGELDADSENKYSAKIAYINRYFDAEISKDAGGSTHRWSLIRVRPVK